MKKLAVIPLKSHAGPDLLVKSLKLYNGNNHDIKDLYQQNSELWFIHFCGTFY